MHALIIGASGFVGRHIAAVLGPERSTCTFNRRTIAGGVPFDAMSGRLRSLLPDLPKRPTHAIVLYGAIDMEGCRRDPVGTARVNVVSVINVLDDLIAAKITPVFISTDYVFDGTKPLWTETDYPYPRMAYGSQKRAAEQWLTATDAPHLIIRFSKVVSGDTQIHSLLGQWVTEIRSGKPMRCADDQFFSPGYVEDVAGCVAKLAETGATGLYHLGGPERFSRIGLLRLLVEQISRVDPSVRPEITPCSLHDLPFLEKRPLDTSVSIEKLQHAINWPFIRMADLCARVAADHFSPTSTSGGSTRTALPENLARSVIKTSTQSRT